MLLPVLVVGQVKATGFTSIAGVDTTVLSVGLLLAVSAFYFLRDPRYPVRQMLPFLLFALVVLLGVARSEPWSYQGLKARDFFLLTGVIVACLPVVLRGVGDLRGLIVVWFGGGVFVAGLVFLEGGSEDLYGRAGIGDATLGPAYLAAAAVVVGAVAWGEKLLRPSLAVPGIAVAGVAMIAIGSRGPLIAVFAGLVAWIVMRGIFRIRTLVVFLLVGVVAVMGVNRASDAALSRLVLEDETRRELWTTALDAFTEHSILGLGWGDFSAFAPVNRYPHNLLLETASELGLLGLVALALLLGTAAFRVWRNVDLAEARVVGCLAVTLLAGQMFSFDLTNRLLWVALITCLLLPVLCRPVTVDREVRAEGRRRNEAHRPRS